MLQEGLWGWDLVGKGRERVGGEDVEEVSVDESCEAGLFDFPLCSYCEDGFMHCTMSGVPGSLLPDAVLSSPLSHRSEYCPHGRPVDSVLPRFLTCGMAGESWVTPSDVCVHPGMGLGLCE